MRKKNAKDTKRYPDWDAHSSFSEVCRCPIKQANKWINKQTLNYLILDHVCSDDRMVPLSRSHCMLNRASCIEQPGKKNNKLYPDSLKVSNQSNKQINRQTNILMYAQTTERFHSRAATACSPELHVRNAGHRKQDLIKLLLWDTKANEATRRRF